MIPLRDTIPSRSKPVVIWYLIATNIFVFLLQYLVSGNQAGSIAYNFGFIPSKFNELIQYRPLLVLTYYPIITGLFIHGGFFHVISNMWALWIFGDNVEDLMGSTRFFTFYILCGIIANLTHFIFSMSSDVPAIGASGAIAGVMGAYLIMFPKSKIVTLVPLFIIPLFLPIPAVIYLLIWFFSQLYSGAANVLFDGRIVGGIAWWAHIGGFTFGAVVHRLFLMRRYYRYI